MTIGLLINTCEPFYRGGYERRAWSFARELARQGHEVRIYTSCPSDETIEGVRFIRLALPRNYFNRRGVRNGFSDVLFALGIFRLLLKLRRLELDVLDVCATPFLHLPIAAMVAWVKKIPMVLTCHEALLVSLPEYVGERGNKNALARSVVVAEMALLYRWGMGCTSSRVAVSLQTADAMQRENYPAEAVVEFGLEKEAYRSTPPTLQPSPVRFVFCGRLTLIKAVDQSIRALASLRAAGIACTFDIIGNGGDLNRLRELARKLGVGEAIRFHGEVSEETKREIFSRSEIFLLSSPREGFSIATLEAMAQGCAVVMVNDAKRPSGALDFVGDGSEGLCVGPGEIALQQAMLKLIDDPALRLRLREAAWRKAGTYRIEKQARRLAEFYIRVEPQAGF